MKLDEVKEGGGCEKCDERVSGGQSGIECEMCRLF